MSMENKKVAIIGIGNCGSQVASLAEKKYSTLFDVVCINSSSTDLSQVPSTVTKYKVGEKDEVEGSGKDREKMKEYLEKDISKLIDDKKLEDILDDKKYAFIIVSAAGGTGSGAGPVFTDMIRQSYPWVNFILVGVLPTLDSSPAEQGNTKEFLDELYNFMGPTTYMIYDNETTSTLGSTIKLTSVNEAIIEDIRVLTGVDNFSTPYESIDEADLEAILTTPGRIVVARVTKNITEKTVEDNDLGDMLIKALKQSCNAEVDKSKSIPRWGIITFFTEEVNNIFKTDFASLKAYIGEPIEKFNHNAVNRQSDDLNFMYLIAAGLPPINDRVKKINDAIKRLMEKLPEDDATYKGEDEGVSYSIMEKRKRIARESKMDQKIDPKGTFSKYKKH